MKRSYAVRLCLFIVPLLICITSSTALAQITAFTYQGKLADANNPSGNGNYDMQFKLFDTPGVGTGTLQGSFTNPTVAVSSGNFTVTLDFGSDVFTGAPRYLEIGVRPAGNPIAYTVLSPRQSITSTPYAIQTINATQLGGLPPSRFVQFDDNNNVGIGTPMPSAKLTLSGAGAYNAPGAARFDLFNSAADTGFLQHVTNTGLWQIATTGGATRMVIDPSGNVGIGTDAPTARLTVSGSGAYNDLTAARFDLFNSAWENGFLQHVTDAGLWQIATTAGATRMAIDPAGLVGIGTTTPPHQLGIVGGPAWTSSGWAGAISLPNVSAIGWTGNASGYRFGIGQTNGGLYFFRTASPLGTPGSPAIYDMRISDAGNTSISGMLSIGAYPEGHANGPDLCAGGGFPTFAGTIGICASSSLRYKTDVQSFRTGLQAVKKLRPVTFRWKADGVPDLGLIAEEVAKVDPRLAYGDGKGEVVGVKYRQLNMLLINAIKEQQAQITYQQQQIQKEHARNRRQLKEIEELKRLFCATHPKTRACRRQQHDL